MQQILAVLMLVIILSGCGGRSEYMSDQEERETRVQSFALIHALEVYHQDHEVYPATLALLVPDYLPAMIKTAMGTDFQYRWSEEGDYYVLSIREASCDYTSYPPPPPDYPDQWICIGI